MRWNCCCVQWRAAPPMALVRRPSTVGQQMTGGAGRERGYRARSSEGGVGNRQRSVRCGPEERSLLEKQQKTSNSKLNVPKYVNGCGRNAVSHVLLLKGMKRNSR
jgi:hypothetical protein